MERIKKSTIIILIFCSSLFFNSCSNCNVDENIQYETSLIKASRHCAEDQLRKEVHIMLENSNSQNERLKKISFSVKLILSRDNVIEKSFMEMLKTQNINNYDKDKLIKKLNYFEDGIYEILDDKSSALLKKYLSEVGFYNNIKENYSDNDSLRLMILKKHLIIKLATIESINLLYG